MFLGFGLLSIGSPWGVLAVGCSRRALEVSATATRVRAFRHLVQGQRIYRSFG